MKISAREGLIVEKKKRLNKETHKVKKNYENILINLDSFKPGGYSSELYINLDGFVLVWNDTEGRLVAVFTFDSNLDQCVMEYVKEDPEVVRHIDTNKRYYFI